MTDDACLLRLYISRRTSEITRSIDLIEQICAEELCGECTFEVIDVREHPELAEERRIIATPTLVKELPPPLRRVIGDLSDRSKILVSLDFGPRQQA